MATFKSEEKDDCYLSLEVNEISVNQKENTSQVKWELYLNSGVWHDIDAYVDSNKTKGYIDGKEVWKAPSYVSVVFGSNKKIGSGTETIKHNTDGTKTVKISFSFSTSGYSKPQGLSLNVDFPLTRILIPSTATVSNPTPKFGETVTIKINSVDPNYTHTLYIGSKTVKERQIATDVKTSFTWTVPESLAREMTGPDNALWLEIRTYIGSQEIGSKKQYAAFRVQASESLLPDGTISYKDINEKSLSTGTYLRGYSLIELTASGTAKEGATLKDTELFFDGKIYDKETIPENAGQIEAKAVFTDSRNARKVITKLIDVYDYKAPQIEQVNMTQGKTSIVVHVKGQVDTIKGNNTKKLTIKYKPLNAETFEERVVIIDWNFDIEQTISGIDISLTYQFIIELEDKVTVTVWNNLSGKPVISRLAGGKGVTLFKDADQEGFWVGDVDYTITAQEFERLTSLLN